MQKVDPKLLAILIGAITLFFYLKISSPHKQYSRQVYWENATVESVHALPQEVLQPGNKHGPVLMWAASAVDDPEVIIALVERGADINEADSGTFSGTPLSAAASYANNPDIIDTLIALGADVNKVVGSNRKTPLIIAAELNPNARILERLIIHGADISYQDLTGRTALEQARRFENESAIQLLEALSGERIYSVQ